MISSTQIDLIPEVVLTSGEIEAWQPREDITISKWGEKYFVLVEGEWKGELLDLSQTPYLRFPMDAWGWPWLKREIIIGPNQGGKSTIMNVCWAHGQHQLDARALMLLADEQTAGDIAVERLAEIIRRSPALSARRTGSPKDLNRKNLKLQTSLTRMGWPRGEATMETFSYQQVFEDEMALYAWDGKTMDPVAKGEARIRAYKYSGRVMGASAVRHELDFAWLNLLRCEAIMVYMARCPECGELQFMNTGQLRWDEEVAERPDRIRSKNLAWYKCEVCGASWGEIERRKAVRDGDYQACQWDPKERTFTPVEDPPERPTSLGILFSAFHLPTVTLGQITALVIQAETDPAADLELHQSYLALPYHGERSPRAEDQILAHCDHRPEGLVPPEATQLTVTVDVQKLGFYVTWRAWAPGPAKEGWLIIKAFVEGDPKQYPSGWVNLKRFIFNSMFKKPDGTEMVLRAGLVDAGWATTETYDFCFANPPLRPSMGFRNLDGGVFRIKRLKTHGDMIRFDLNTTVLKDTLAAKINATPGSPGAWHLYSNLLDPRKPPEKTNLGRLADYAAQMCSEIKGEDGYWIPIGKRPNHYWDCEAMQMGMANILRIAHMAPPGEENPKPKGPKPPAEPRDPRKRPEWFKNRR